MFKPMSDLKIFPQYLQNSITKLEKFNKIFFLTKRKKLFSTDFTAQA